MTYMYSCVRRFYGYFIVVSKQNDMSKKKTIEREEKIRHISEIHISTRISRESFLSIDRCQRETDGRIDEEKYTRIYMIKNMIQNIISALAIESIAIKSLF